MPPGGQNCVAAGHCSNFAGFFHYVEPEPATSTADCAKYYALPGYGEHISIIDAMYGVYDEGNVSGPGYAFHDFEIWGGSSPFQWYGAESAPHYVISKPPGTFGLVNGDKFELMACGGDGTWSDVLIQGHWTVTNNCVNATATPSATPRADYCGEVKPKAEYDGLHAGDVFSISMWLLSPETCPVDIPEFTLDLTALGWGHLTLPRMIICWQLLRTGEIVVLGIHIMLDNFLTIAGAIGIMRWFLRGQ